MLDPLLSLFMRDIKKHEIGSQAIDADSEFRLIMHRQIHMAEIHNIRR